MKTVRLGGGICHRMRALLGWRHRAGRKGLPVRFVWMKDHHTPADYGELFEPLPGVVWKTPELEDLLLAPAEGSPFRRIVGPLWEEVRPVREIREEVARQLGRMDSLFSAMHIRRTDLVPTLMRSGKLVRAEEYDRWIEEQGGDIWLATDNTVTQERFARRWGKHLFHGGAMEFPGAHRQTSIARAVVDLYVCAAAREFKGTPLSSFTATVGHLHNA